MRFLENFLRSFGGHHRRHSGHHGKPYDRDYNDYSRNERPGAYPPPGQQPENVQHAGRTCAACGNLNAAQTRFCDQCGRPLATEQCPKCGAALRAGAAFCGQCGQKL